MNTVRTAAILAVALSSHVLAQSSQPAGDPLAALQWTVGEWRLDAKWANGNPIRAVATYEPIVGGKFLRASTRVEPAGGGEMIDRDVVVYGVQGGQLTQWTFAQDGSVRVVAATPTDDGSLFFEWVKPGVDGKPGLPLRLRISRDGDALRWQQFTQLKGEWHSTLDGRYVRQPAARPTK